MASLAAQHRTCAPDEPHTQDGRQGWQLEQPPAKLSQLPQLPQLPQLHAACTQLTFMLACARSLTGRQAHDMCNSQGPKWKGANTDMCVGHTQASHIYSPTFGQGVTGTYSASHAMQIQGKG